MKLVPYEKKYLEAVRAADPSAAQGLEFNGDVLKETAVVALSDGGELLAFGFISRGTLNFGVFSLYAEFGVIPSAEEAVEAAEAVLTRLKASFMELKETYAKAAADKLPDKTKVRLTIWTSKDRADYNEFLKENGFRFSGRSMAVLSKDLTALWNRELTASGDRKLNVPGNPMYMFVVSGNEAFTVLTPEGKEVKARIEELPISDPDMRKRYLTANGKAFGYPDSEAGLIFRGEHWKARLFCVVRTDPETGKEILASVTVWPRKDRAAATEDIFCIPEYRRQHLTERLLVHVLSRLQTEGFNTASMNAFTQNTPALKLYEKLGYRTVHTLYELAYTGEE